MGARAPGRPREPRRPRLPAGLRRDRCRRPASGSPARPRSWPTPAASRFGFPKEYGGEDDAGGSVTSIEMLALRRPVADGQGRRPVGPVRRRAAAAGHRAAPRRRTCATIMSFDLPGCFAMTETGHGSDVQQLRTTCTYDPATQTFDLHTPHQAARKDYIGNAAKDGRMAVVFAQLITGGKNHGVHAWLVPIRDERRHARARRHHRGRRPEGRPQRRRQRPADASTTCRCRATCCSTATARSPRTAPTPARSRTRPAASSPCSARWCAAGSASAARRPSATKLALDIAVRYGDVRRQFAAPGDDREIVDQRLPGRTSASCCRRWPPPTRCTSRRTSWSRRMHDVQTAARHGVDEERRSASWSPAPPGSRSRQTWHATRDDPDVPRGLRRRRLPAGEPAAAPQGRHRRLHHVRGRQHRAAAAGRQGPAHRLPRRVRLAGRLGQGRLRRRHGAARRSWSGRRPARSSQRLVDAVPGRDDEVPMLDRGWQLEDVRVPREAHRSRARSGGCARTRRPRAWRRSTCSTTSRTTC